MGSILFYGGTLILEIIIFDLSPFFLWGFFLVLILYNRECDYIILNEA